MTLQRPNSIAPAKIEFVILLEQHPRYPGQHETLHLQKLFLRKIMRANYFT